MRNNLVSVLAGRALPYLRIAKPSNILPFTGDFPVIKSQTEFYEYKREIEKTFLLQDLSEKHQRITLAGNRISLMESSFKKFLKDNDITFDKLDSKQKTKTMLRWMDSDCLTVESLKITY